MKITYDYGTFGVYYIEKENHLNYYSNVKSIYEVLKLEIEVSGELLKELQDMIKNVDIYSDQSNIRGNIRLLILANYGVKLNDGSFLIIDDSYTVQYFKGENDYILYNLQDFAKKVIEIVIYNNSTYGEVRVFFQDEKTKGIHLSRDIQEYIKNLFI